ncbi:hypothetical protein [Streptosporangium subroseum]|nr:hypothetical protein OHB15_18020 [Streptosporangium subroseum]
MSEFLPAIRDNTEIENGPNAAHILDRRRTSPFQASGEAGGNG